jgi:membrane-bound lytic murein transglycosylase A
MKRTTLDRVLLYVDDPVELFFLQVQGSGRVRLPDGQTVRLAYADQNGHPYQSIGRVLVDRGELSLEQASMAGIKQWARANPGRVNDLLNANPSYVFFREQPINGSDGPSGALGVPLTPERSIAVDARYAPLGAPVFLSTSQPDSTTPLRRLVLAQDTGGAIRGCRARRSILGLRCASRQSGRSHETARTDVGTPAAGRRTKIGQTWCKLVHQIPVTVHQREFPHHSGAMSLPGIGASH